MALKKLEFMPETKRESGTVDTYYYAILPDIIPHTVQSSPSCTSIAIVLLPT